MTAIPVTRSIAIDSDGDRAAENGTWVGTWRGPHGDMTRSGCYLAVWKASAATWILESELYVTLT